MQLSIAKTVWQTEAEGPGVRAAVWVQGCPLRCPDCCNPEMLAERGGLEVSVADLVAQMDPAAIEGISLLGGEPFAQAAGCALLAHAARSLGLTVMVFSGFTLAELRARRDAEVDRLLEACDLLVDGRYDRALPDSRRRWIGSTNQKMHFLTSAYSSSDPRFLARNTIELRLQGSRLTVNGWPEAADRVRPKRGGSSR